MMPLPISAEPKSLPTQLEGPDGWTPWIEPEDYHEYLIQCCGCGLVHKFQILPVKVKRDENGNILEWKEIFNTRKAVILRATVTGAK